MKGRILIAEDRDSLREFLVEALVSGGFEVISARDGVEAARLLDGNKVDLLLTDLKMPGRDGLSLIQKIHAEGRDTASIVLTAYGSIDNAVAAIKLGAYDYLVKPLESPTALREAVQKALEARVRQGNSASQTAANSSEIVASDPATVKVLKMLDRVASTDTAVLLTGESGTGKEVAARRIHNRSKRAENGFIAVNCAAISPQLMESEMFGHEKGAFTGATEARKGRFELADGGTLFLDEVGELPLQLQAKLLRVLQESAFERVGGTATQRVNVRIIAATNRDLRSDINEGRFREDLFHRLSVFPVHLPPLRERPSDILPLCDAFLGGFATRHNGKPLPLSDAAREVILAHPWPGNIRELRNALERAAILAENGVISPEDLGLSNPSQAVVGTNSLREHEKEAIRRALRQTDGHRKKAAELLGMGLRTLYTKIKEYGLE